MRENDGAFKTETEANLYLILLPVPAYIKVQQGDRFK